MTCAACVNRVEKDLTRLGGVTATVNPATGRARVGHPTEVTADDLVAVVERTGYTAELPPVTEPRAATGRSYRARDAGVPGRGRLLIASPQQGGSLPRTCVPRLAMRN